MCRLFIPKQQKLLYLSSSRKHFVCHRHGIDWKRLSSSSLFLVLCISRILQLLSMRKGHCGAAWLLGARAWLAAARLPCCCSRCALGVTAVSLLCLVAAGLRLYSFVVFIFVRIIRYGTRSRLVQAERRFPSLLLLGSAERSGASERCLVSQEVAACWSPLQQALGFGTCLCLSFLYLFLCIRFDGLSWTAPACARSVLWCLCFVLALRSSFVHVVGGLLPALSRFFVVLTHVCVPFLCTSSGVALHVGCASLVCVSAVPRRYVVLCVLWVLSRTLVFVCSCGGGCLSPASTLGALLFFPRW